MYSILMALMALFALAGAIDRVAGNRLGLGKEFENGILAMGTLALAMLGIIAIAPVLSGVLSPVVAPVYRLLGADPAMFAGTILACDMGAGPLAQALTQDPQAAALGGVITGSMLGATLVFSLPVALGILEPEDRPALARGILCGVVTIPLGVLASGLAAGFAPRMVLRNLTPIAVLSVAIALGLWRFEKAMIRGFGILGKGITALITLGLGLAIAQTLTGVELLKGLDSLEVGFSTVGAIAIVLAGAFPLVYTLTRLLRKPLMALGRRLGINDAAAAGLIACLANAVAAFGLVKDMDKRGKVVVMAFSVSAAFTFGDHLGFTAGYAPELLGPVILGKLLAGITAAALALLITRKEK